MCSALCMQKSQQSVLVGIHELRQMEVMSCWVVKKRLAANPLSPPFSSTSKTLSYTRAQSLCIQKCKQHSAENACCNQEQIQNSESMYLKPVHSAGQHGTQTRWPLCASRSHPDHLATGCLIGICNLQSHEPRQRKKHHIDFALIDVDDEHSKDKAWVRQGVLIWRKFT